MLGICMSVKPELKPILFWVALKQSRDKLVSNKTTFYYHRNSLQSKNTDAQRE